MPYANLLLPVDHGKKPYRMHARFASAAYPREEWLVKARNACAEAFIRDMAKQGWHYVDRPGPEFALQLTGPFTKMPPPSLAPIGQQERWHFNARTDDPLASRLRIPHETPGVHTLAPRTETDEWEWDISAVFVHDTILMELPDD